MKILTILGTRPEIIKMSRVIDLFDKNTDHVLINSNQNYDKNLNKIFFKELGIKEPKYNLKAAGENSSETISNIFIKIEKILNKEKPDGVMIYGDTNTGLSSIIVKKHKIPIFHMEAGNRCFDENVPEEINRKIIDHISDINIVLTDNAKQYLISEGIKGNKIFKVGSHVPEVITFYKKNISNSKILNKLKLKKNSYILASIHREENLDIDNNIISIMNSLDEVAKKFNKKIIFSTHPRTKLKIENIKNTISLKNFVFSDPFGFFDYIKLATNSLCTLSDSGTIVEDSVINGFKAVMIRETNERPEAFDNGILFMSGLNKDNIIKCIDLSIKSKDKKPNLYAYSTDINISNKILKIVLSYIDYVKKYNWQSHKNNE